MRKSQSLCILLLVLVALSTGCRSSKTVREKQRYRTVENGFADQGARSEYIDRRTHELTKAGVKEADAAARASREWFSRSGSTVQVPTAYELKRREAETDIRTYLDQRNETGGR